MAAADDLEKKLRDMPWADFTALAQRTQMFPTPAPQTGIDLPDEKDRESQIKRFLSCRHNNAAQFERILTAANIPSDAERAAARSELTASSVAQLAAQAARANELAQDANRIAAGSNEIARAAKSESKLAKRLAIAAGLLTLAVAVAKAVEYVWPLLNATIRGPSAVSTQPTDGSTIWAYVCLFIVWAITWTGYGGVKELLLWLHGSRQRPRLSMALSNPLFMIRATADSEQVRFCHIGVYNHGRSVATDCQVRLMAVADFNSGNPIPGSGPTVLHWAHQELDCGKLDILPNETKEVDLFFQSVANADQIRPFRIASHPDGIVSDYPKGKYTWHLRLTAENAKTRDCRLVVSHSGTSWDDAPVVRLVQGDRQPAA